MANILLNPSDVHVVILREHRYLAGFVFEKPEVGRHVMRAVAAAVNEVLAAMETAEIS